MPAYQTTYYPEDMSIPIQVMDLTPSGNAYKHNYNKVFTQTTARGPMYNVLVAKDNMIDAVIAGLRLIKKEIKQNNDTNRT